MKLESNGTKLTITLECEDREERDAIYNHIVTDCPVEVTNTRFTLEVKGATRTRWVGDEQ